MRANRFIPTFIPIFSVLLIPFLSFSQEKDTPKTIDFKQLEKQQTYQQIAPDEQVPTEEFIPPKALQLRSNQFILTSVRCVQKICKPYVATLTGTPTNYNVVKSIELPIPIGLIKNIRNYDILPPLVTDINGDGKKEVIARYEIMTHPRAGEGSLLYTYLAIVSLENLSPMLFVEKSRTGQGAIDLHCDSLWQQPTDRDDKLTKFDLLMTRSCTMKRCKDFPYRVGCRSETEVFGFQFNPKTNTYSQAVSFSGKFVSLPSPIMKNK